MEQCVYSEAIMARPPFQLHLEPAEPIELGDLLRCLAAIGHQFEAFAAGEGLAPPSQAKLLVSSVRPGSIDIGLLPDITTFGTLMAPVMVYSPQVLKFATSLKGLIDKFKKKAPVEATIKECNDAIAIGSATASSGGTQTFNIHKGDIYTPVFVITVTEAQKVVENATLTKSFLEGGASDDHQRVPFMWHGLDTEGARTSGKRSPDKGIIEDIDPKPKPVFFEDEFAHFKLEMLADNDNPYKKVYFVDVKVSRIGGRVVSYRVVGFHGSADRE